MLKLDQLASKKVAIAVLPGLAVCAAMTAGAVLQTATTSDAALQPISSNVAVNTGFGETPASPMFSKKKKKKAKPRRGSRHENAGSYSE